MVPTAEYHAQASEQGKSFSATILPKLTSNLAVHRKDWETGILPVTYVYDA